MPIYEYKCGSCGFKFEYLCRSASERLVCQKCKGVDLKKLVSTFSFASSSACSGCTSSNCASCTR